MSLLHEIENMVGEAESETLEYKVVLPPSKTMAQIICSFANSQGGYLVLGVAEVSGKIELRGLSEDFQAVPIIHKAIDLLLPRPSIDYNYIELKGKKLFVVKVDKSQQSIAIEGKIYKRIGGSIVLSNPEEKTFRHDGYERIQEINGRLKNLMPSSTNSKTKLIEHYQSILKIIDDLRNLLYPENSYTPTRNQEGKILSRILFSSVVDNFETYLSDLLYEIYLARPETLKSNQQVTIEDVLNCSDLDDFVQYWAKQKIGKLQKGSVKGFIKDNRQIRELCVIDSSKQEEIERILQIRHLYSHRNGIVDEKFLHYHPGSYPLNTEHQMSIDEILDKVGYLSDIVNDLDRESINKYSLAVIN